MAVGVRLKFFPARVSHGLLVLAVGMSSGTKRRRTDGSDLPATVSSKEGAGDDLAGDGGELICEAATRVLQKYSLGVMRVPLDELGVSPLNRKISGSHVQTLGRRILSVEGFVRWRYRHGWAHEPNPDDPLEVARNTNAVARASALVPQVPMVPLKGSIAKTHLLTFLQCLRDGTVCWSDTKQLMVPPEGQAVLAEHLKYGMFYEVFSFDCVREDKVALQSLCQADNFDSAFALGETEMSLLQCIHASLTIVKPPVGKTLWDVVRETTAKSCGQRWSDEDVIAIYNFSKVIGAAHLAFLTDVVAVHIPWDEIAVRPSDFHLLARIRASFPWLKIALLTAQYFPPDGRVTPGPFGKNYGNLFSKGELERIARASGVSLTNVEAFLAYLTEKYMGCAGVSKEKLAVEIPAAFARTARAVLLTRDLDTSAMDVRKIETKLREKLGGEGLPPPFEQPDMEDAKAKPDQARARLGAIAPDTLPSVTFENGSAIEDSVVLARAKRLELGCRVAALRPVRSIRKGGEGTLVSLGKEALVCWDAGALTDVAGEGTHERSITIASLELVPAKRADRPSSVHKETSTRVEVLLPAGQPWVKLTPEMGASAMRHMVLGALYQLFANRSAGPDQVMIEKVDEGAQARVLCLTDFKPRGLIIFPQVLELRETSGKANKSTPLLWVNAGASEFKFDITPVTPAAEKIGATIGDENSGASGDEEAGASPLPLDIFWLVYKAQKATPDGCLSISHVELTIPLHMGIQVKDAAVRAGMTKNGTAWYPHASRF